MDSNTSASGNVRSILPSAPATDELGVVRNLLLAPVHLKEAATDDLIKELQERMAGVEKRTEDFSQVLPASIRTLHEQDKNLNVELEPEITSGLYKCFKTQPEAMADALYPILGPAVRKLVASLFQSGSDDEKGNPYQVEQIFLIHKETSLVLTQSILNADAVRDADLVSGMLDAIRSFVQEAFSLSEYDGMNSINLGDLTIWVEWGPKAILAVVIRGMPSQELQAHYAEMLRLIHQRYESELGDFDGDSAAFDTLELSEIVVEAVEGSGKKEKPVVSFVHSVVAVFTAMFLIANHVSNERAWQSHLAALAAEPGVVVINEERGWRTHKLSILRDPLAASKGMILERARVDTKNVRVSWFAFASHDPAIAARRESVR